MDSVKWRKIKEIFQAATDLPAGKRPAFVSEQCGGDAELRFEIEKMLAFTDDTADDPFEKNAFQIITGGDSSLPDRIGDYKIIRKVGHGGMGTVYEAVREKENFTQQVALKVIRRGMDTDVILSRFRHEQQILSSLQHPFIARFLDGGMTADDLPFYAMEFVEGEFIDDYCRRKNLDVEQRLELFRKVCEAVQYAHQQLVIHRDLKPRNILVTKDGTPKLLDFGIGKILSENEAPEEAGTATAWGMMTPAYAAPEQIRGERIGTTGDIYSLGVILFELLTGEKPYKTDSKSQLEIQKAILETDPPKPSSVGNRELPIADSEETGNRKSRVKNPKLKGDLDNIILKALRKDPGRRYVSVQQFSEDLRRHLMGLPVSARPLTWKYRASKFIRRNRVSVVAALLVFLSLLAGITVAVWQAYEARRAERVAQKRFDEVRQLANNVVHKYYDEIADLPGSTRARQILVSDALKYLDNLAVNADDNPELLKELSNAYLKMGDVQGKMYRANIGDTGGAIESYRKAVSLMEKAVEKYPDDTEAKEILVRAYDNLVFLMMRAGENISEAKRMVGKAIGLHEEIIQKAPNSDRLKIQLIDLLIRLGDADVGSGETQDFTVRLDHHLKAVLPAEDLYRADPEDFEKVTTLARVYQRIGSDYFWIGEQLEEEGNEPEKAAEMFAKALESYAKSFEMVEKMGALEPGKNVVRQYQAAALVNLAGALAANGRFEEALRMAEKNLKIAEDNLAADKVNKEANFAVSVAFELLAEVYFRKKDYRKSVECRSKTLNVDREIYLNDKRNLEVLGRIPIHHRKLARLYDLIGDGPRAGFHRSESEKFDKIFGKNMNSADR
ncbi:MAG: protein kinase [Pyrinomonadaceae bacterium]